MAVRTATLAKARPSAAGTFVSIYTCPAGRTAIVKDVRACFLSATSASAFLEVLSGGVEYNVGTWTGVFPTIVGGAVWIVLEPGDSLRVWQTLANGVSWWISGAELNGVAP